MSASLQFTQSWSEWLTSYSEKFYRPLWQVNPSLTMSAGIQRRRVDMKFTKKSIILIDSNNSPEEASIRQIKRVNLNIEPLISIV